jgi:integrase
MGRQHVRNGLIAMRRKNTGVPFYVPVTAQLQAAIDAMPPSDHLTFIVTEFGKPYTSDGFGRWFRKACDKAGLPRMDADTRKSRCTPHGLRKAGATRLAQRGATTTQLMAWFGWKTSAEADRYTQAVEREQAALMAAEVLKPRTLIGKPEPPFAKTSDNLLK